MIKVKNLSKSFGTSKAVQDVTLTVVCPGTVVVVGSSGSGKTTLLRLIAGLEMPDRGEIFINGTLVSRAGYTLEPHKRNIGFVFQTPALWPHMTVSQNILFGLYHLSRSEARRRLNVLLDAAELNGLGHRYPHQLSGGEARRVALIRTLAPRPCYLLMDEPLVNIDPLLKNKMLTLIKNELLMTEACLGYVTHDREEARQISTNMLEMENGILQTCRGDE